MVWSAAYMIWSFTNRETQRFFEGHRVAAFQEFAYQAARRLVLLDSAETLRDLSALPVTRLRRCAVTALDSTAFGSTISGESASAGRITGRARWRLWTITEIGVEHGR